MLYATTRDKHDVVTAYKAAHTDCYSDGGLFVPFRMPLLPKEQLEALSLAAPEQILADVLNLFFSCGLTATDVEQILGRRPIRPTSIGRHLWMAELWIGAGKDADAVVQRISDHICADQKGSAPTNWMHVAVRIALLFAVYGNLLSRGQLRPHSVFDVAVTAGDFATPMAVWYGRQMGLPVGNIICGCNSNGGFWDLLNRGEFSTRNVPVKTATPLVDIVVPRNLERLICGILGEEANAHYLQCCNAGRTYTVAADDLKRISAGMFAAVISDSRMATIIPGVYRTRQYVLSPYAALAYGSLQDYRAMTGHTRPAILLSERSPMLDRQMVCQLLHKNEMELSTLVGR